jgi:hypothetical protein
MKSNLSDINTVEVICIERLTTPDGRTHLVLENRESIRATIPAGVWTDNQEPVPEPGTIRISSAMHKSWFADTFRAAYDGYSRSIREGFSTIMQQRHVFEADLQLLNIKPNWFRSGMAYIGGFTYNFGTLLKAWSESDELRTPDGKSFIITLSGSPLSGMHYYEAWNAEDGIFKATGLTDWKTRLFYLKDFPAVQKPGDRPTLENMKRLLVKTGLLPLA